MKDNTKWLLAFTYVILFLSVSVLINDFRDFNFEQFREFKSWARVADKNESWFTSQNVIEWSFYAISATLFFWRGYLIYHFTYFISIIKEIESGNYFTNKVINYFKKIGDAFIYYVISVFVLKVLLAFIGLYSFKIINEFREELLFLIPGGLAFRLLAEVFKRAKETQEENELTI